MITLNKQREGKDMATHSIEIKPPTWVTALSIYLEVLRTNEWYSEAGQDARKWIYELGTMMDTINKEGLLKGEDAQYVMDSVRKEA